MHLYLKSLHLIFVVTWFAGLFYIVRLFIYHVEALSMNEDKKSILSNQFKIMSRRLWYIITWPSAVITIAIGVTFLILNPNLLEFNYMKLKLFFVVGLLAYHVWCHFTYLQLQKEIVKYTTNRLRIINEIATLLLVAIIFLIVLKNEFNWIYGTIMFFGTGALLMAGIKIYKKLREHK